MAKPTPTDFSEDRECPHCGRRALYCEEHLWANSGWFSRYSGAMSGAEPEDEDDE